ncbi:MAG: hypothetical protein H6591_13995 [Flavobacteriales bacterium]|nr:hypothetical protein [Flavobacteriales bacterium]
MAAQVGTERFGHIGSQQGLSQGTVYSFCQDRQGFLWMGTQDGLNRWDGHEMRVWKHEPLDARSLSQGYIRALLATDDDKLWIGTEGGGLDRLDLRTGVVKRFPLPVPGSVFSLARRHDGLILVGGTMGLLALDSQDERFRAIAFPMVAPDDPECALVHTMLVDEDDSAWLATKYGLFHVPANGASPVHYRHDPQDATSLPKANIKALHRDVAGDLWVGTYGGGLCRMRSDGDGFESFTAPGLEFVYGITTDRYGHLWVGSFNGLHVLDIDGHLLRSYHKDALDEHALRSDLILATYRDRTGLIWVSTSGQGVSLTDPAPDQFHVLDDRSGSGARLTESFVYGITEDRQGRLLIATAGGGVNLWDRSSDRMSTLDGDRQRERGASCEVTRCVLEDSKGRLWVGTDKCGLDRRGTDGRWKNYTRRKDDATSLPSNVVLTVIEDRSGTIWLGTYAGGLARYNEATDDFTAYAHDPDDANSLPGNIVRCILEDHDGVLWVGTGGAGLSRFDRESGTFTSYTVQPATPGSITSNFIRCLHQDRLGRLWVGTNGGGLCLMQPGEHGAFRFLPFTMREGLSDNVVYGITESANGDLWLSTNAGLSAFHTDHALRSITPNEDRNAPLITHYAAHRGIQRGEFNGGAFLRDRAGWMFFGGVNGITWFHPDSIRHAAANLPVVLTDLQVRNRPVLIDTTSGRAANHLRMVGEQYRLDRLPNHIDTLVIPYAASLFSFTFSAIDHRDTDEASYYYALEGLDKEWNAIGTRRFISFTNLDPGSYTLKLGASTSGSAPEAPGKLVRIVIVPPFWLTGWFRAALLLATLLAVVLAVRYRHRKLRRENARMQHLVQERTQQLSEQKLLVENRNEQLEELNALNRRILSVISHDFKGPLISMRLLIDLLRSGSYERLDLHTSDIRNQLVQSEMVLQNLLDWAKLELGEGPARPDGQQARHSDVVRGIVAELEPMVKEKALHVEIQVEEGELVSVPLDVLRIIYRNLISNALKYSPAGGSITCGFLTAGKELFVQDQGPGIDQGLADRLFKGPVHSSLGTHHERGFGLGLYLTTELIQQHGGSIRVETGATGSRFLFRFPQRA